MISAFLVDFLDATSSTRTLCRPVNKDLLPHVAVCDAPYSTKVVYKSEIQPSGNMNARVYVRPSINVDQLIEKSTSLEYNTIDNGAKMFANTLSEYFEDRNIQPSNVFPLSEGGLAIEIVNGSTYYNLEVANNGEASFYKEQPHETPEGWEYSYTELITRLQKEFNG